MSSVGVGESENGGAQTHVSERTWVPISVIVGLVLILFGIKAWLDAQFTGIREDMIGLRYDLKAMSEKLNGGSSDRWTGTDQCILMARWAALNPTLKVPEISDLMGDAK